MSTVFIYALKCPVTARIRYVGKSKNPTRRFNSHLSRAPGDRDHRANWIRSLITTGAKPLLEIVDEVSEEHWPQWEVAYIEFFREQGCDLVNSTLGGEDPPSALGKKLPKGANAGKNNPMFGKTHTAQARAKISAAQRGVKENFTLEHCQKLSIAAKRREALKRLQKEIS